jgi:hypothetical protein
MIRLGRAVWSLYLHHFSLEFAWNVKTILSDFRIGNTKKTNIVMPILLLLAEYFVSIRLR